MTVRGIDGRATHFLGQVIIEDSNPDTASIFAAIAPLPGGCIIIIDPPVDPPVDPRVDPPVAPPVVPPVVVPPALPIANAPVIVEAKTSPTPTPASAAPATLPRPGSIRSFYCCQQQV